MLHVIVSDNKEERRAERERILAALGAHELLSLDESLSDLASLEAYLYPSLFSVNVPVVNGRFMIASGEAADDLWKKFAASPTVYLFEEFALPAGLRKTIEKAGGAIHLSEKKKNPSKKNPFAAADLLGISDKKARWLAYQTALSEEPIEALLGIMYWKLRTLAATSDRFKTLYRALILAHADAWKRGVPLALAVEKVLLTDF